MSAVALALSPQAPAVPADGPDALWRIGAVTLAGRALLAPMAGVTDAPFRRQALAMGAPAAISEMVACEAFLSERRDMLRRAAPLPGSDAPQIRQLAGREPHWMRLGAERARADGIDIIDINMGCPAKEVAGAQAGAALMRDLDRAARLIGATLEGAKSVPVTVKMRLGWDDNSLHQAPALAARAQALGVSAIVLHARTRCQFYKGRADWAAARAVRAAITLPLIINGDIVDLASARAALDQSGADGVMIGRGALGRPYLVGEIAAGLAGRAFRRPDRATLGRALLALYEDSLAFYGRALGAKTARKHIAAWIEADRGTDPDGAGLAFRRRICAETEPDLVRAAIADWFARPVIAEPER